MNGINFYANPKRLFVGQDLSLKEVVAHLDAIKYTSTETPGRPGTYVLKGGHTLHITPRLVEFQPVTLTFKGDRIAGIKVEATPDHKTSGSVWETVIEPEPLGAFIATIEDDEASRMFVRRYLVQPADVIGTHLFYATMAREDGTFLSHNGVRYASILSNLLTSFDGIDGGGSSITVQVIKNAISMDWSRTISRKIDELFLAAALERRMSKEEIFTLYANSVFLGGGKGSTNIYGFLAASVEYFGKRSIRDLTLSEASTLAAMLHRPNYYVRMARGNDYAELTRRRDRTLTLMHRNWPEKFPEEVIEAAKREPVRFNTMGPYEEQPVDVISRGFVKYASKQQHLLDLKDLAPADYAGLHVYCSVDPDLMREAERILSTSIPAIERRFPPAHKGGCNGHNDRLLGTIVAIDPRTGEIASMYGGAGGKDGSQFSNFALNAKGSPASTIKPFWVTKALEEARLPQGQRYTAASVIDPQNAVIDGWKPRIGVGGKGRIRELLAGSRDDFPVFTLDLIGLEKGKNFYQTLTGAEVARPTGQLAIGFGEGVEVSPLQLAKAYSIYSRNGLLVETTPISKVYLSGKELEVKREPDRHVAGAGESFITAQMLRSVVGDAPDGQLGTARYAFGRTGLSRDTEIGGKTGSGPNDIWMVSVSPRLVVVVWLGYQCHSEIKDHLKLLASDTAALIWAEFIKSVRKFRPDLLAGNFERPRNVTEANIDPARGCYSEAGTGIREFFIRGTEPIACHAQ
ncbi:MAG TPA: transglycosylase domain-containing protein [Blastocatellia bacterium]|nr:transglycosylase domain-containing protein [Blastocatellia bacterium]